MAGFIIGIVVIGGLWYWLSQLSRKAERECIALLGLTAVSRGAATHGQSAEGLDYVERVIAEGSLHGVVAQLSSRNIRSDRVARAKRDRGAFTVLSMQLSRPPPAPLRLQPAGVARAAEWFLGRPPDPVLTGDAEFDLAWHLYATHPEAAILAVDASLRVALMRLHRLILPTGPSGVSNKLASGLLLGSFELTETVARCYVVGTPSTQTGERLKLAEPILARLALAARLVVKVLFCFLPDR